MKRATVEVTGSAITSDQTSAPSALSKHRLKRVGRFVGAVLTVMLLIVWFVLFRPQVLGGHAAFVGVNGISMTPTMDNGDLAVIEKEPSYHVGDIIAYHIPNGEPGAGGNVIHRIVGGNGTTGYITQGDHNSYTDYFWHPKAASVVGRVWFHIPRGATWLSKFREPMTLALTIGLMSFFILIWPGKRPQRPSKPPASD
jgi:signal peptidase I